jgi:hypothetical protein
MNPSTRDERDALLDALPATYVEHRDPGLPSPFSASEIAEVPGFIAFACV